MNHAFVSYIISYFLNALFDISIFLIAFYSYRVDCVTSFDLKRYIDKIRFPSRLLVIKSIRYIPKLMLVFIELPAVKPCILF